MISLSLHLRQSLGDWVLTATLTEEYGVGFEKCTSRTVWQAPLTEQEWEGDPLSSVLSAVSRWSDLTMPRP
jgi:hypothetical protein